MNIVNTPNIIPAAVKLKSMNQFDQANHLLRIIRGLDSETANKLQLELQQSS